MGQTEGIAVTAIGALDSCPWHWLPPSAIVDLTLLLGCGKPAVRTMLVSRQGRFNLERWAARSGLDLAGDQDGYIAMASVAGQAEEVLRVDRRPEAHERELGRLLGYPDCCTVAAAAVCEAKLDEWAAAAAESTYRPAFRSLQTSGYGSGASLLSHVPCAANCRPSLALALEAWGFVLRGAEAGSPVLTAYRTRLSRQLAI